MTIIVTGGAGYIGAHVVRALADAGKDVVVVDDLSTSSAGRVRAHPLHRLDLAASDATNRLAAVLDQHRATGIIHLAAKKQVGESVARPEWYFRQNVGGLGTVLEAARAVGCDRLVFSSSAAVYGEPVGGVVTEDTPVAPINPYGQTKAVGEWMVRDAARAWGLRQVSLRYFNVAGAGHHDLGDPAVLNLMTLVLDRLEAREAPVVFGDDYPTPDGTCVRDYVHVADLADAHVAALNDLERDDRRYDTFDVATGRGVSVAEMLAAIAAVTGNAIEPRVVARRLGDPAVLVATAQRLRTELGWEPRHGLDDIVGSAWQAWVSQRESGVEPIRAAV
ncbi:UDP-glucose 4-epimerase GalE [Cellulomonas rhizosphaerae]|uniref:UDP-glucose 4-epimerase n=1 Tax=Cellulomonas rhizosphaerae TaxID=2293719 RepID=A0A413RJU3_9CELL|nr:UDP-glucose 4-epimerase GalE [Cellulomonas rhizosphaerae]RHA38908.1 UDP-glucose 4-epimerase GalE [Cellulomonas rhizosphaerae]